MGRLYFIWTVSISIFGFGVVLLNNAIIVTDKRTFVSEATQTLSFQRSSVLCLLLRRTIFGEQQLFHYVLLEIIFQIQLFTVLVATELGNIRLAMETQVGYKHLPT